MFFSRILRPRVVAPLALTAIFGAAGYGFAGGNTLPDAADIRAGSDTSTISGYTVSNVDYVTADIAPGNIQQVKFSLDSAASVVKVGLTAGGTLYACTNVEVDDEPTLNWQCAITDAVSPATATDLTVVATQ